MSVTATPQRGPAHSIHSATLADVLERILDKGLVIAGDIKIKLVDIELLTIQIRLIVASVEKAREMGMDWWVTNKEFCTHDQNESPGELAELRSRMAQLEGRLAALPSAPAIAVPQPAASL
ncbi:MAG: gas vesicle protein [Isosphaeraceae bacterium]|nr:gas vesicle protein [Isosphaeraceae bacterium]